MPKFKSEEEICSGCYCKRLSQETNVRLSMVCHGRPSFKTLEDKSQLLCVCYKCIVKMVCQDTCKKYRFYENITKGKVSIKVYQQTY